MIILPREIRKAIRKRKIIRSLAFLSTTILVAVIIAKWGDMIFPLPESLVVFKYSFYAVLLILPFFLTKFYLIFTDTNYCGEVKQVDITQAIGSRTAMPVRGQLYKKNEIYIEVEDEAGKIFKKKAYETPYKVGVNPEMYKVGDKVLHLHSSPVTIVLPDAADTHCLCSMCGWSNDKSNDICTRCGLPLIKSL